MVISAEVFGVFATNSYFYIDESSQHGFLIDPGAQAPKLLRFINERRLTIEKILLTHGHFDHIGAVEDIQRALNIPVCMQKNGVQYVQNPAWNLSEFFGAPIVLSDVSYIDDFSEICLSANPNFKLQLLPLAGHTTDSAVFYSRADNLAFVGDSIFKGAVGRSDFPGGDQTALFENIKKIIFSLPDNTVLFSGHSDPTSVKDEKFNFFSD